MGKVWMLYLASAILLSCVVCAYLWLQNPLLSEFGVSLPIPSIFSLSKNPQVATLDLWQPKDVLGTSDTTDLGFSARSALSYDLATNTLLYTKNSEEQEPMASLTKIMTAIVSLEHPKSDNQYLVREQSLVGNDSMGLSAGEVLTLQDLLYGLVLNSGNDAAEVLADNFPGGRHAFIAAMNEKVRALGLSHTHFTNPSGLEGDGDQHTTVYDLLVMTQYALSHFPMFRSTVATVQIDIPATPTHKEYALFNETNLLTSYPGVKGVKDGYTPEAGLCLVTYLDYKGHQILAILLGSDDRRGEMKQLLDYSLKKEGITPPVHE